MKANSTKCAVCRPGLYGSRNGAESEDEACIECDRGRYSVDKGADHMSKCKNNLGSRDRYCTYLHEMCPYVCRCRYMCV